MYVVLAVLITSRTFGNGIVHTYQNKLSGVCVLTICLLLFGRQQSVKYCRQRIFGELWATFNSFGTVIRTPDGSLPSRFYYDINHKNEQ